MNRKPKLAFAKLVEQTGYVPPKKKSKPTNVKKALLKQNEKTRREKNPPVNIADTINATINELDIKPNSLDSRSIIHSAIDRI